MKGEGKGRRGDEERRERVERASCYVCTRRQHLVLE